MALKLKQRKIPALIGWLVLCFTASAIGALATFQAQTFYSQLIQPAWAPPPSIFGPVWTLLYAMMAVAAWLVCNSGGFRGNRAALSLFLAQLAVNALWSWLFFTWHLGSIALVDIGLLWLLIAATIFFFWRVHPLAGGLLIPYLLWVSFASALNYSLWQLNPLILS
ncbi:MAG: benzodiazapine receptor [Pseudohongiellaceae bacterium]|jgi:tryptophan-rich sensory protein